MRRVDRRTNALPTDRPTDRLTNQPTDTACYTGALSHLKTRCSETGMLTNEKANQIDYDRLKIKTRCSETDTCDK